MLTINVIGRFSVGRSDNTDVTPRGRKACGLLAMLALSPRKTRTRVWLQDKLWSDRGGEQAAGSLRQALSEIRQALGADRAALVSDNVAVGLDPELVAVDIDDLPRALAKLPPMAGRPELLEGFDVRDQEFENWLRTTRTAFAEGLCHLRGETGTRAEGGPPPVPPRVILTTESGSTADTVIAGFLAHRVAQAIAESGTVRVQSAERETAEGHGSPATAGGVEVRATVHREGPETALRLSLFSEQGREVLWSSIRTLPESADRIVDHPGAQQLCNQAADAAVQFMRRAAGRKPAAAHLAFEAVHRIFSLRQVDLDKADQLLVRAQEMDPCGIYPAWRAFLRTILVGERRPVSIDEVRTESEALVREALEREPNNSNVYALAAHVNHLVLDNSEAAIMLAETSLALNPGNPLAHAHLGTVCAHAGRCEEGYLHALTGLSVAGNGPYRYQIMMDCCLTAIMTGRYREAIYHAECARALSPEFLPPIRYLAALYFNGGNTERAARLLRELRRREPDFTVDLLRDESYPAATLRRTPLIEIARARGLAEA